ncbi:Predicted secreted hydrolase [Modicisalibacter muralis]|uniref:Predicted secreted hydrolase n=1 Tax=Modicisalibacter muralis TaxID=119000 RepID=A0A1G9KIX6_9GAMM|nr:lipocalin-like domain-containing protein [Halomonas muralis]SDL49353.1 Predicted secreted hydrolase [Halomonas muralis]
MKRSAWACVVVLAAIAIAVLGWQFRPAGEPSSSGYAGLADSSGDFAVAGPHIELRFPQDHGPHPDYRIEWWYLTANLRGEDGRPFGVQWTLFRQALAPPTALATDDQPWSSRQLWMAHAAVSTPSDHYFAERFARGGIKQAGVRITPFAAWLDNWSLMAPPATRGLEHLEVTAQGDDFGYRLQLTAEGPLVRHGDGGFSQKSADGQGSMYYSQPFYRVSGEVRIAGESIAVSGRAWLDREWSSQLLGPGQSGWDWFSLHLDSGAKLMAFRLRGGGEANAGDYVSGSWISAQGQVTPLGDDQGDEELRLTPLAHSRVAGRRLPTAWRVEVPGHGLDFEVRARHPKQWMGTSFAYWEGMVAVEGSHAGVGYLEMTGY